MKIKTLRVLAIGTVIAVISCLTLSELAEAHGRGRGGGRRGYGGGGYGGWGGYAFMPTVVQDNLDLPNQVLHMAPLQ